MSSSDTTNNSGHCRYSTDGVDWPTTDLTGPGSAHRQGFTVASHSGRLWFAAFSGGSIDEYREFRVTSYDTLMWADWGLHHQHKSMYPPALDSFLGKLYMTYTNLDGQVCVTTRDSGSWPAPVPLSRTSTGSPALTVLGWQDLIIGELPPGLRRGEFCCPLPPRRIVLRSRPRSYR
ncbi:hypothetical protein [Streptomyces syringium]|uniref:hypothetical protein n=1 Tax=Streptomyces syringium TaxID=76729 RepID=UPI00342869BB